MLLSLPKQNVHGSGFSPFQLDLFALLCLNYATQFSLLQ